MSSICVATHHLPLPRRPRFGQQQESSGPLICFLSSISSFCFETRFLSGVRSSTGRVQSQYAAVVKGNGWSETLSPILMFDSGNMSDDLFSGPHLWKSERRIRKHNKYKYMYTNNNSNKNNMKCSKSLSRVKIKILLPGWIRTGVNENERFRIH